MGVAPVIPLNYSQTHGSAGSTSLSDAQTFQLMLQQNMNKMISGMDSLFESNSDNNSSSSDSFFGSSGDFLSSVTGSTQTSDSGIYGSGANTSPILEMIARSNLIGKTVEATDPSTGQTISGKVNSVFYENNILLFDVGGKKIPPENLLKVTS